MNTCSTSRSHEIPARLLNEARLCDRYRVPCLGISPYNPAVLCTREGISSASGILVVGLAAFFYAYSVDLDVGVKMARPMDL